jgi:hypothetical protein
MTRYHDDIPWERQRGEPTRAFAAFCVYRDLGPGRSITAVARILGRNRVGVGKLSARYRWVERAAAFDREEDRRKLEARFAEAERMATRHAQVAQLFIQMLGLPAQALAARMREDPEGVLDELRWTTRTNRHGETERVQRPVTELLRLIRTLASAVVQIAQMERLARGAPTERAELTGPGGTPLVSTTVTIDDDPDRLAEVIDVLRSVGALPLAGGEEAPSGGALA